MSRSDRLNKLREAFASCMNDFFVYLRDGEVDEMYKMLSPNLKYLTSEKRFSSKYQKVFLIGTNVTAFHITEFAEPELGYLMGLVTAYIIRPEAPGSGVVVSKDGKLEYEVDNEDLVCRAYNVRLIQLQDFWWIDQISLDETSWND